MQEQTEERKFVDTDTTVGTRLDDAASNARENTVSMHTVAAANPLPATARTIQQSHNGTAPDTKNAARDRAALLSKVSLPQRAALAPRSPAIAARTAACLSRPEKEFILSKTKKETRKKKKNELLEMMMMMESIMDAIVKKMKYSVISLT